jgi:hypothetical protein
MPSASDESRWWQTQGWAQGAGRGGILKHVVKQVLFLRRHLSVEPRRTPGAECRQDKYCRGEQSYSESLA